MIAGVGSVAVLVRDPEASAEWYRDKLGFDVVVAEGHTVFVRPKATQGGMIHLCGPCKDWGGETPGGRTGIWLACGEMRTRRDEKRGLLIPSSRPEDVERTYLELKKNGVEFSEELRTLDWGKAAIFRDPDGNEFEIS